MLLACDNATGIPFPYFSANKIATNILGLVEAFTTMAEVQTG